MTESHIAFNEDDLYYADVPVGEILRLKREAFGCLLRDAESALHIRESFLSAIEQGAYDQLPGRTYALGFIRTYAEYLGLNPERMVKLYKSQADNQAISRHIQERPLASNDNAPKVKLIALSLLAFFLISLLVNRTGMLPEHVIKAPPLAPVASITHSASEKAGIPGLNAVEQAPQTLYY